LSSPAFAETKPAWTWQEPNVEIYQPSFSADGKEIVLVRKRHIPDYAEAEGLSEAELKKRTAPIDENMRYADPEIVILKIGDPKAKYVDWGWSPVFSPDGSNIVYAFQEKAISRFRILAESMAGNDIRIYNRADTTSRVLAEPKSGYLDEPIFSPDGTKIIYSFCDATNGAYGGSVGLGEVSLDGAQSKVLLEPAKDFDLFRLVSSPRYIGGRLLAIRSQPLAGGVHLADGYRSELLDVGSPAKPLYTWTGTDPFSEGRDFAGTSLENLKVYDEKWRPVSGKAESSKEGVTPPAGTFSPDGRFLDVVSDKGIDIVERATGKTLHQIEIPGGIQGLAWSPDSRRFAIVETQKDGEKFLADVLKVYDIAP
jgi:dipeptidyl aminopeptidase/acylaminoacyl peptidase